MTLDRRRLAATITRLRRQAGLSQRDLAGKARISRSTLAGIEAGPAMASLDTVVALADALGVTVDALIEEAR